MTAKTIVTCFPLDETHVEKIRETAKTDFDIIVSGQDKIAEDLFKADIFCGHAKVPVDWNSVVDQGKLTWIQSSAAGLDHCLTPPVIASPIVVTGCSALFAPQVGEQMMSLLMGLIRRSPVFFKAQQIKEYVRRPTDNIFGKTVGIIGMGGNGHRIARVLRPMVQRIIGTDRFPEACAKIVSERTVEKVYTADELDVLLPQCDVVIVTLPLSDANEKLISDNEFGLIKAGTYLINVGRGSVVDTESLVRALSTGHLGGAGIDVVDPEPLPVDSPLWELDNVIVSPHVGAQSPLRIPATIELFCDNLNRYRSGDPLLNLVDKELGFPRPENRISF